MKTLYESLLDDFDTLVANTDYKKDVIQFLSDNYMGDFKISQKPNKEGFYIVTNATSKQIKTINKQMHSLTNGLFIFGTITSDFFISRMDNLESLQGAPKKITGSFLCNDCPKLKNFIGGPKEVCRDVQCEFSGIESLEGAPVKVGLDFDCNHCYNLTSLKGAPKTIGNCFYCYGCKNLESLEGAPKTVSCAFDCSGCKVQFTEEDVKKVSKVKKTIRV
jgi:hypothetical protein